MNERGHAALPDPPAARAACVLGLCLVLPVLLCEARAAARAGETVWLDSLNLGRIRQDRMTARRNRAVGGAELSIAARTFARGVGTHARSRFLVRLGGGAARFVAFVGVDNEVRGRPATVVFRVLGDGKPLWSSGLMKQGQAAKKIDLDVRGVQVLALVVSDGGDGIEADHADWADARFEVTAGRPKGIIRMTAKPYVLTPAPPAAPRINGARVFGVRAGSPFLFTIPATGERPMTFAASDLPDGLKLDAADGRITGRLAAAARHVVTLRASNAHGTAERTLRIEVSDRVALTPPLGWNSWNCWGAKVDQKKVLRAAEAMVASGLIRHGWTYVNIDDGWQGRRKSPTGPLEPNEKFPDMKGLCDAVHALGLKIGIYSTPWVSSYAGFSGGSSGDPGYVAEHPHLGREEIIKRKWYEGVHRCESADAKQFAAWGIDYLKYDWNPIEAPAATRMRDALAACGRDVVYSLSNNAPFEKARRWAGLANCWRTTGDIRDSWRSMAGIGFAQNRWKPFAGPGHWNDPDMLVVGHVGWGKPRPSGLTPDEQYTHISLWCLLSAPLMLGCDLTKLDEFTLNLLRNDEVLAVNQDPLGAQAGRVSKGRYVEVWAKDMSDGAKAVGLFNRDDLETQAAVAAWSDLGLAGRYKVRDLWRQKDLGAFEGRFEADVPPHGVILVKISKE